MTEQEIDTLRATASIHDEETKAGKRRYLVLPSELSDGSARVVFDLWSENDHVALSEMIRDWLDEATEGEELVIGWTALTDQEVVDLKEL